MAAKVLTMCYFLGAAWVHPCCIGMIKVGSYKSFSFLLGLLGTVTKILTRRYFLDRCEKDKIMTQTLPSRTVLTISQLNHSARMILEDGFASAWVEGEISNLARPSSGHWYFSLKDNQAQVRCAFFRGKASFLPFTPANGMQVVVRAKVSLYEPRGDFQLLVEHMEESGAGALQRAFEALKQRLQQEGLFDPARKRPLPALPQRIGVITSPSGAAVRDIISVLKRRFAAIPVLIYPVPVQGKEAPAALVKALHTANQRRDCEVLIVARGGGSLEDLQAFNHESVARAIAASALPVVSAVGHEIDFTIADFVADQRAPTPSAAAELLSPDGQTWQRQNTALAQRLSAAMQRQLNLAQRHLEQVRLRLHHPGQRLQMLAQRLDDLELRLHHSLRQALRQQQQRLHQVGLRLTHVNPQQRISPLHQQLNYLDARLRRALHAHMQQRREQLGYLAHALDTVSPLATLQRGYAIVSDSDGKILRDANMCAPGDKIHARLHQGNLQCYIEKVLA
jgi:exodeoxyribonuclease VII large subunit